MAGESRLERHVRRYWAEVWSEGRVEVAAAFYAPRFELNGRELTPQRFAEGAAAWLAHFAEFRTDVDRLFACGDVVVSRVVYRARHTGDFETVPATGAAFELTGLDVFEFDEELVVRHWHETDHWEMFRQLGAEPRPAAQ